MISQSAEKKIVEMAELKMKDAFGDAEVFAALLAQSEREAQTRFVAPEYLAERAVVCEWEADDGTVCVTMFPLGTEPGAESGAEPASATADATANATANAWRECKHALYYHGGGLVMQVGPPHWGFCLELVERLGCAVTMPVYPLLPTAQWQQAHESVLAAYRGVLERTGAGEGELIVMGDSAGGLLSITLAMLCELHELPRPAGLITLSPMTDLSFVIPAEKKAELEVDDPLIGFEGLGQIPYLWVPEEQDREDFPPSVLYGPMGNLPEQWVFAGSREALLPEMLEYVRRVEEAGSPIVLDVREGMWHTYPLMLDMDEGLETFNRIVSIAEGMWA